MISVSVNGDARSVSPGTTVAGLVEAMGCGPRGVAVAVNSEVVPRSTWPDAEIHDGDQIEILHAVQGGC